MNYAKINNCSIIIDYFGDILSTFEKEILISSIQNQVIDIYFKSNIFKKAYIVFFLGKRNLRNSIKIVKKIISKENFFLNILMYIIFYVSRS